MQLRTTDRAAAIGALEAIASQPAEMPQQFYVTEAVDGWLALFPNFTPALESTGKALSTRLGCLVVMLLSADEDELYCMFFRGGRQLPWFKVGAPRKRTGKEREKLAAKIDALAEVCDDAARARLVEVLADTTNVTFSSDLLRAVSEATGIRNAFSSFEYLQRGEREGLVLSGEPTLVPASRL